MDINEIMTNHKEAIANYCRYLKHKGHDDHGQQLMGYLASKAIHKPDDKAGLEIGNLALSIKEPDATDPYFETGLIDGLLQSSFDDQGIVEFVIRHLNLTLNVLLSVRFQNDHPKAWFYLMGKVLSEREDLNINELIKVLVGIHNTISNMNMDDKQTFSLMMDLSLKPALKFFKEVPLYELIQKVRSKYKDKPSIVYFRMFRVMRKWVSRETFENMYKELHLYDSSYAWMLLHRDGFRRAIARIWPDLRYIQDNDIKGLPTKPAKKLSIVEVAGDHALVEVPGKTQYLLKKKIHPDGDRDVVMVSTIKHLPQHYDLSTIMADQYI